MRSILILIFFLLSFTVIDAQIKLEEAPLESNPVLQRAAQEKSKALEARMTRLFGEPSANDRSVAGDCEDDGIYESGETVYILSGDTVEICLDTTGFVSFTDLSIGGNSGSLSIDSTCVTYISDTGVELGIGDTIRIELCLPDNGTCLLREFPLVVIRENETTIEALTIVDTEMDALLCVDPANYNLPSRIVGSNILDGHDPNLFSAFNVDFGDSCAYIVANRFAGLDTLSLLIKNNFCIEDIHKFPVRVVGDTLSLPFLDDFSYDGPYPNNLWLDKKAFVNNRWGYQPPTVGFATMDGLDEGGVPYGNGYGRADFLTSNYLDLSSFDSGDNVYLTCYAQPKGYGYNPNLSDSLVIELRKSNGQWVRIHSFQGMDGEIDVDSLPPFDNYFSFPILSDNYFYNGFQFRFVNYAQRTGIRDVWHIDNVKVTADLIPDGTFEDIAFTNIPNDILKRYSSLPWRHFDGSMLIDSIDIELYSQLDVVETANPSGLILRELTSGTEVINSEVLLLLETVTMNENQRNVPPQEHKFYTNPVPAGISDVASFTDDKLVFEMEYHFDTDSENPGQFPAVERNNSVKSKTVFDNYFAYDDGSAETALFVGEGTGESVAVRYTAAEADVLRAVQIHFPHYTNQDNARFNILVHTGTLGNIVHEQFGLRPFFADNVFDTLQGFTTIRLKDDFGELAPVEIPAGDFYIQLEQATNITPTRVGLDKNSPEAEPFQHWRIFGQWGTLENEGAIMMRPVVGDFTPPNTPVEDVADQVETIKVYPNPSTGLIYFDLNKIEISDIEVTAFNALGQLMINQQLERPEMDLQLFENGIYYIQLKNQKTNKVSTHKVVIFRN